MKKANAEINKANTACEKFANDVIPSLKAPDVSKYTNNTTNNPN